MSKVCLSALLTLALLPAPSAAQAVEQFVGTMLGATVVPPAASPGTGPMELFYDPVARTLSVSLSFSSLIGTSTGSHIHCCSDPGTNVGVAIFFVSFPLGVTSGTFDETFDLTLPSTYNAPFLTANGGTAAAAEAALAAGMRAGRAYVDVHTIMWPGGEIRAYTTPVIFLGDFESGTTDEWSQVEG